MVDIEELKALVLEAGKILCDRCLSGDVTVKGDADFVTKADFTVQEFMRRELGARYPEVAFIAEENKLNGDGADGAAFILDPVDGTTNLMHGFNQSVVSLGYFEGGQGIHGVVYNPFLGELFTASRGKGAYLNGEPIHCKERHKFSECIAIVEFSPYYKEQSVETFEMMRRLFVQVQDIRSIGAAAVGLMNVAAGRADLFMSKLLKPWDYAAAEVILAEAGCRFSDFAGKAPSLGGVDHIIAGADGVFDQLAAFASEYAD